MKKLGVLQSLQLKIFCYVEIQNIRKKPSSKGGPIVMRPSADSFPWVTGANCLSVYIPINLVGSTSKADRRLSGNFTFSASFCPRREKLSALGKPQHRVGSFVTFLAHQEKQKKENQMVI